MPPKGKTNTVIFLKPRLIKKNHIVSKDFVKDAIIK